MNITFSIPNRSSRLVPSTDSNFRYEVARLKLVITMKASPDGSSVSYNGETVTLDNTRVIGGDILDYRQIPEAVNQVAIELLLRSDFVGGDFLVFNYDYPDNPKPRRLELMLNGGGEPTELRWGAYAAATGFGGGAYRRVTGSSGSPTFVTVTTTNPALPASNKRLPLDVAFVMDRSGSMMDEVVSGTPKFSLLKTALRQFIDAFSIDKTSQPDDRLALVWFESTATTESFLGVSPWAPKANWGTVKDRIDAQITGNMTAMGDGISQGVKVCHDSGSSNNPMIVLFTDGIQNAGHQIVDQPPAGNLDYFDLDDGAYRPLNHRSIPTGAIGIGVPSFDIKDTLQNIAKETGGGIYKDAKPERIGFGFHSLLISALKGDVLGLLQQTESTLPVGSNTSTAVSFTVGNGCPQLMFCLYWLGSAHPQALDLRIVRPNGTQATPDKRLDDASHTVQTIQNPQAGEWQVAVTRRAGVPAVEKIPFFLSVIANEGQVSMDLRFAAEKQIAGKPLHLVLELDEDGGPIDMSQVRGRVTIEVRAPQVDSGTYLNELAMPSYAPITRLLGPKLQDIQSPLELKLKYYSRLGYLTSLLLPDKPTDVLSFEVGTGAPLPDNVRVDSGGISVRYTATKYPGTYRFKARLELQSEVSGPIVCQKEATAALRIGTIDPNRLVVRAQVYTSPLKRYAHLAILAYDEQGNLLGPGYDDQVDVRAERPGIRVEYIHNLKGDSVYSFRLIGLAPREDPSIKISIFGKVVREGLLSEFTDKPPDFPNKWGKELAHYKRGITLQRKRQLR